MDIHIVIADWEHYEGSYKIVGIYNSLKKAKLKKDSFEKQNSNTTVLIYTKKIKL
jgi:hypothetical protein